MPSGKIQIRLPQAENLGVITYSPLGGGLLTGKYGVGKRPESGRLIDNKMYQTRYSLDWMFETADRFTEFAGKNHFDPAGLAIAWVAGHPAVTAPIIGARNMDQLKSAVAAMDINMTPELRDEISALSPEPPPATDRNEERTPFNYGMR